MKVEIRILYGFGLYINYNPEAKNVILIIGCFSFQFSLDNGAL